MSYKREKGSLQGPMVVSCPEPPPLPVSCLGELAASVDRKRRL